MPSNVQIKILCVDYELIIIAIEMYPNTLHLSDVYFTIRYVMNYFCIILCRKFPAIGTINK